MIPPKDIGCHRTGFQKTCFECVTEHKCRLWSHLIGTDPNTGQEINGYFCADEVRNKFLMDGAKETRQAAAAIESFRNEMVRQNSLILEPMRYISG